MIYHDYYNHQCPDRCDMEFYYTWNHTNLNQNIVTSQLQYLLNAGDTISISLQYVDPQKVKVVFNNETLELTNDGNNTWTGTIPSTWNTTGTFNVILEKGSCRMLLYEGLMNSIDNSTCSLTNSIYGLTDSFIQTSSKGVTISRDDNGNFHVNTNDDLIKSSDDTINVDNEEGSYDLSVKETSNEDVIINDKNVEG